MVDQRSAACAECAASGRGVQSWESHGQWQGRACVESALASQLHPVRAAVRNYSVNSCFCDHGVCALAPPPPPLPGCRYCCPEMRPAPPRSRAIRERQAAVDPHAVPYSACPLRIEDDQAITGQGQNAHHVQPHASCIWVQLPELVVALLPWFVIAALAPGLQIVAV